MQSPGQTSHACKKVVHSQLDFYQYFVLQSLIEHLGFGNIKIEDDNIELEDQSDNIDDTINIYTEDQNGDAENDTSPSHSGGITSSDEEERLEDFEEDLSDRIEAHGNNDTDDNRGERIHHDEYQFTPSPSPAEQRKGSKRKAERKRSWTSSEPAAARVKKCRVCNKIVPSDSNFKKHIVTHMYDKWPEVGASHCHICDKKLGNRKFLIKHLATIHNQLEEKLEAEGETVEQYEVDLEDEAEARGE